MKAIIPVAGVGTGLRPHTYTQPKPLIPVAGKPILGFILDQLIEAGVDEFIFVIGYLGEKIIAFVDEQYPTISKVYVTQRVRKGLGDAIWHTRDLICDEPSIIILLGDTIVECDISGFVHQSGSSLAIQKVQDPRSFGVVELSGNGKIKAVVEKPLIPKSNLAITGLYKIDEISLLLQSLEQLENKYANSPEMQIQLTDALMKMIGMGVDFNTFEVNHWYDCGNKDVLIETNRALLRRSTMDVGAQFVFDNTIIIPPVVYGQNCQFTNAIIGPDVTLGNNVRIQNTVIRDSIVGHFVRIEDSVLNSSVIGNDAIIKGRKHSLNIGDNNEIDFS